MFRLKPFDIIYVHRKPDFQVQRIVRVEGEVKYPGLYTLNTRTERVSDIIRRAGGLTTEAYEHGARLIRQHDAIDRPEIERSEEHTSELQSRGHLVCRLLLEKKK